MSAYGCVVCVGDEQGVYDEDQREQHDALAVDGIEDLCGDVFADSRFGEGECGLLIAFGGQVDRGWRF